MKSSKSFLLCLLAGFFISANCAALEDKAGVDFTTTTLATTTSVVGEKSDVKEITTVPPVTNSTTVPPPSNTTTIAPETTTVPTTTPASTTTPALNTTTPATTTTTTPDTTTSTTPTPTTTTPASTTETPPTSSTTAAPPVPCHRFDGPSFIGGMVLTLGLLAISLVAYKFYKARNERNYHTL